MKNTDYTSKIISKLPYWFAMKKQPSGSIGKAFLRTMGMELDEIFSTLDYMYEQISIDKMDTEMISDCYKTILPENATLPLSHVEGDGDTVHRVEDMRDFYNYRSNVHNYDLMEDIDGYYIDEERKILYSRRDYHIFEITDSEQRILQVDLRLHKIWNYFDELGLLLNTPRLIGEDNYDYRNRLKDVFRNPSSSAYQGLVNGIARELGCRVEIMVEDSSKDIELQEDMIVPTHVSSEGEPVEKERIKRNQEGKLVLAGDEDGKRKDISYVHSVKTHSFSDYIGQEDIPLESELFYSNGRATPKLREYAELINELCPIMWNYARWDESHWIQDMSKFGYVPSLYDASIEGFRLEDAEPIVDNFVTDKATAF